MSLAQQFGVRVIDSPKSGLSHARNLALKAATGKYIAYLDDDAYPDPHWLTYLAGRMVIGVDYLSMPNLLARQEVYPEFVQHAATAENISRTALALLADRTGLEAMRFTLASLVEPLRRAGASQRAARAILKLLNPKP